MYAFIEIHGTSARADRLSLNDSTYHLFEHELLPSDKIIHIGESSDNVNLSDFICFYRFRIAFSLQMFKTVRRLLLKNGLDESLDSVDFRKMTLTIASRTGDELDSAAELAAGIMHCWDFSLSKKIKDHQAIIDAENAFFAARSGE